MSEKQVYTKDDEIDRIRRRLELYADPRNWTGENENVFIPPIEIAHYGKEGYQYAKRILEEVG